MSNIEELYKLQKLFSDHRDKYNKFYCELIEKIRCNKEHIKKFVPFQIVPVGYGDSFIINNVFDTQNIHPDNIFTRLLNETNWTTMKHKTGDVPRLISIQYINNNEGDEPVYRHPVDIQPPSEPMSHIVQYVKNIIEFKFSKILGFSPFNHVLVQLYRNGHDHIKHHSDKTLDIINGSPIINVSFGCTRKLKLKSKFCDITGKKDIVDIDMKHNSMFVLGHRTNRFYTHGIKPDKRPSSVKSPDELSFNEQRISLTFRSIGSFRKNNGDVYGIGNSSISREDQSEKMLIAFGKENKFYHLEHNEIYGNGFNCINFETLLH